MAIYTLLQAQSYLDQAHAAREKALEAQSYQKGDVAMNRAQLSHLDKDISKWEKWVSRLSGGRKGGMRAAQVVPIG